MTHLALLFEPVDEGHKGRRQRLGKALGVQAALVPNRVLLRPQGPKALLEPRHQRRLALRDVRQERRHHHHHHRVKDEVARAGLQEGVGGQERDSGVVVGHCVRVGGVGSVLDGWVRVRALDGRIWGEVACLRVCVCVCVCVMTPSGGYLHGFCL